MKSVKFGVSLLVASSIVASVAFNCLADETSTVNVDASTGDETVSVGNIDVTSGDGADVYASNGNTATLTVDGNITANDDGIQAGANDSGSVVVTVNGDIAAPDDDALYMDVYDNGNATVTVNGNLSAEDGMNIYDHDSGSTDVTVNGNITSTDDAIYFYVENQGSISVTVDGDISAGYYGISGYCDEESSVSVSVTGNIEAEVAAMEIDASEGSTVDIDVTGNLTGKSDRSPAVGIWGYDGDSKTTILIDGDITGTQKGIYAYLEETDYLDMVVTGVITGAEVPVRVSNDSEYTDDNFTLTAWKIVPNSDGIIADAALYYSVDYDPANEAVDFEKSINYIVKYDQPSEGGTISAKATDGSALAQYGGYDTAREAQSIILSADLEDGYEIVAAYNGEAKTPLTKDADGNYVVEVERGGGLLFSVELQYVSSAQTGEGGYSYLIGAVILLAGGCVALTKIRKKEA